MLARRSLHPYVILCSIYQQELSGVKLKRQGAVVKESGAIGSSSRGTRERYDTIRYDKVWHKTRCEQLLGITTSVSCRRISSSPASCTILYNTYPSNGQRAHCVACFHNGTLPLHTRQLLLVDDAVSR